jgi:hypothetical protein
MKAMTSYSPRESKRKDIKLLCDQGFSFSEVAKKLRVNYKTVKKWSMSDNVKHHYHTKQVSKLSPNTKRRITLKMKDNLGASVRKCVKRLNLSKNYIKRGKTISKTCVQNYIKSTNWGKIARKLRTKPLLSRKNIKDRLDFALSVQLDGYCDQTRHGYTLRENILWTDESPIELNPMPNKQNTRVRTLNKNLLSYGVPKFPIKIMVAGGMTANGVTDLYICPKGETITGRVYENNILPIYLNSLKNKTLFTNQRKATFQQDSAPGHNIRPVINKIQSTFPHSWTVGIWSGNSPDFNVIEHVWSVLQNSVFEHPVPRNREELVTRVREKWFSLKVQYLKKLVHSFPRRIEEAINNEGKHTNY